MNAASATDDFPPLASLLAGDEPALEAAIRQYGGRMLHVAWQLLGNEQDAQEAVQDAFVTAFQSLDQFQHRSSVATWLHRIVVNAALMKRRARSRRPEQSMDSLLPVFQEDGHQWRPPPRWNLSAPAALERKEIREQVRRSIDELPETHRSVLLLRDIQELDTGTVAEILGISPDAVKVRLHRARQALRTLLDPVFGRAAL
jgi:RNA polymerase sigma-70 factor (ECF subfamily)